MLTAAVPTSAAPRQDAAEAPAPAPIELVVAVDASYRLWSWPVHEAVVVILDGLHPDSCALLLVFNEDGIEGLRGRPGEASLRERLVDAPLRRGSRLAEGIAAALEVVSTGVTRIDSTDALPITGTCPAGAGAAEPTHRRRVIALLTAGSNVPAGERMAPLIERARDVGAPWLVLATYHQGSMGTLELRGRPSPFPALRALEALAEPSGGKVFRALEKSEDNYRTIWEALQDLSAALRALATPEAT